MIIYAFAFLQFEGRQSYLALVVYEVNGNAMRYTVIVGLFGRDSYSFGSNSFDDPLLDLKTRSMHDQSYITSRSSNLFSRGMRLNGPMF